ncbi:hypothetical protein [Nocardia sp. NPDC052566]|uniref:hypothetical protein n=1 Tax=Nocardia sp. NPDC052566 TaxID=3364330 RepID=UPI0037C91E26
MRPYFVVGSCGLANAGQPFGAEANRRIRISLSNRMNPSSVNSVAAMKCSNYATSYTDLNGEALMAISLVVFICAGFALGWGNARFARVTVARIAESATAGAGRLLVLSAARLLVLTAVSTSVAYFMRPGGIGIFFGLATFQAAALLRIARPMVGRQT